MPIVLRPTTSIRTVRIASWVTLALALTAGPALATPETGNNNTFATRNIFSAGTTTVEGSLLAPPPDFTFFSDLAGNDVDSFTLTGLTAGDDFVAIIENQMDVILGNVADTVLGVFNQASSLIDTDDDDSPLGDGLAY